MSSYQYTLDSLSQIAVHLTNNAIQIVDDNYGLHEDGNQLSFRQALELCGVDFHSIARTTILDAVKLSLLAVKSKLNRNDNKYCFELLGYDFMIDA